MKNVKPLTYVLTVLLKFKLPVFLLLFVLVGYQPSLSQHSVARQWNDVLLEAIRNDFARPTVHARNLFHTSVAMYDAWAVYDTIAGPYMLGDTIAGFYCPFSGVSAPSNLHAARQEAISFAAFRLLRYRFKNSPGFNKTYDLIDSLFISLGYDSTIVSTNYASGSPATLGNYIAQCLISFGQQDGSNEQNDYTNIYYSSTNPPLIPVLSGNPDLVDPNRWQPLTLQVFIDQAGNVIPINTPSFLGPEWGDVVPFSLRDSDKVIYNRDGDDYQVWCDPGAPPYLDTLNGGGLSEEYKWSFSLVSVWSSHLDPSDSVMWDISPNKIGNIQSYPTTVVGQRSFYNYLDGGDYGIGHGHNPHTGQPYTPQMVPRADYARILAEFWADGPDSETPPGHWFTLINYVSDHPLLEKRWRGTGPILDDLEWDVKSYFALGGAMHDAAISAWSIKGWYDYIRPISALRYMGDRGQSTDTSLSNYSINGLPLVPGLIEVVQVGDPWADTSASNIGKIKLNAWKGPDYIGDPDSTEAGVGWILAEDWWPYQRPTFITPPFAGYVSGHSTYSRTAAELFTILTGDPFFPGGMGEFFAGKNKFLVFEDGPSMDVTLQWATYRDASDQCSLSRIWGGIHPPADDIPGRLIGMKLGPAAFIHAERFMDKRKPRVVSVTPNTVTISDSTVGNSTFDLTIVFDEEMDTTIQLTVSFPLEDPLAKTLSINTITSNWLNDSTFRASYDVADSSETLNNIDVRVSEARDNIGNVQVTHNNPDNFNIDTQNPIIASLATSVDLVTDAEVGIATFSLMVVFSEEMDTTVTPLPSFPVEDPLAKTLVSNPALSVWLDSVTFEARYNVIDSNEHLPEIDINVFNCKDAVGNLQEPFFSADHFSIDTENPAVVSIIPNVNTITDTLVGVGTFSLTVHFDEEMDTTSLPAFGFPVEDPLAQTLSFNSANWDDVNKYILSFNVSDSSEALANIDVRITRALDVSGNTNLPFDGVDNFDIDMENPRVATITPNHSIISDSESGQGAFALIVTFNEDMDTSMDPSVSFPVEDPMVKTLTQSVGHWSDLTTFELEFDVTDSSVFLMDIDVQVAGAKDEAGNEQESFEGMDNFSIDMQNPWVVDLNASPASIIDVDTGQAKFTLMIQYSESMDPAALPAINFPAEDPLSLTFNNNQSSWLTAAVYEAKYDISSILELLSGVDIQIMNAEDAVGNKQLEYGKGEVFSIDIKGLPDGIFSKGLNDGIEVYPNPVYQGDLVMVNTLTFDNEFSLRLYNAQGQLMITRNVEGNVVHFLNTTDIQPGIYLLQMADGNSEFSGRILVLKR